MLSGEECEAAARRFIEVFRSFWSASEYAVGPKEKLVEVLDLLKKQAMIVANSRIVGAYLLRRMESGDPIFLDSQGREVAFLDELFCRHCCAVLDDPHAQILKVIGYYPPQW